MRKYFVYYIYKDIRKTTLAQGFGTMPKDNIIGGPRYTAVTLKTPLSFAEIIEFFRDSLTTDKAMPVMVHCIGYTEGKGRVENNVVPPFLDPTVNVVWDGRKGSLMQRLTTMVPKKLLAQAKQLGNISGQ